MCGRYTLAHPELISGRFGTENRPEDLRPSWNVAPGQRVPVVTRDGPNLAQPMKWGLVPFWSKEPKSPYSTVNARAEGIDRKPAYREPFRRRRCLVPSTGFYEWKREAGGKVPYFFRLKDEGMFAFAGLWDVWHEGQPDELRTYTVLTTAANPLVAPVHGRMPVILSREEEDRWLDPGLSRWEELAPLLGPYPAEAMAAYPVSTEVNSPRNDGPSLAAPARDAPSPGGGPDSA